MAIHRGVYPTGSGMHGLWDPATFQGVNDYDTWAKELESDKDIERHIRAGSFVPLNIGSDGAMEIEVRLGTAAQPATLGQREQPYLIVSSEPYRLHSRGQVNVSGIEYVAVPPEADVGSFPLPAGDYAVTVHLIAWDEEPGMRTDDGPAPGALPDYIVLINPAASVAAYRTDLQTFIQPE